MLRLKHEKDNSADLEFVQIARLKLKGMEGVKFVVKARKIFIVLQTGNIYRWDFMSKPAAEVTDLKLIFQPNLG